MRVSGQFHSHWIRSWVGLRGGMGAVAKIKSVNKTIIYYTEFQINCACTTVKWSVDLWTNLNHDSDRMKDVLSISWIIFWIKRVCLWLVYVSRKTWIYNIVVLQTLSLLYKYKYVISFVHFFFLQTGVLFITNSWMGWFQGGSGRYTDFAFAWRNLIESRKRRLG
jgi:hypothetical protein